MSKNAAAAAAPVGPIHQKSDPLIKGVDDESKVKKNGRRVSGQGFAVLKKRGIAPPRAVI